MADIALPPAPSAKALGKRKADPPGPLDLAPAQANKKQRPQPQQLKQVHKAEKRVTRSSLGGQSKDKDANGGGDEGAPSSLYLPLKTPILLTTRALPHLKEHPPPSASQAGLSSSTAAVEVSPSNPELPGSEIVAAEAPRQEQEPEMPLFRLLNEGELLPPRGQRHTVVSEVDTSDALYLRLHRYPEVLEKRASRLERERLIHERSKLIVELEELRGRSLVYAGTNAGGKAEEDRQKKIKGMEEKLARYDALLPNQPRKSNFLVLGGAGAPGPPAPQPVASTSRRSPSRSASMTASPAPSLPPSRPRIGGPSTRAHPIAPVASTSSSSAPAPAPAPPPAATATAAPAPPPASASVAAEPLRPSTPLSATAGPGNGTTIRIKFGPPIPSPAPSIASTSAPTSAAPRSPARERPRRSSRTDDPTLDLDRFTITGEPRKGPKRDRKAEKARAEERRKLGLAPRANIEKHLYGTKVQKRRPARRASRAASYAEDDDDEGDEEDENSDEPDSDELSELEDGEGGGTGDEWDETDSESGLRVRRRSSTGGRKRPLKRLRLRDSFFHTEEARDAFHATLVKTQPGAPPARPARRSSSRVAYAFGQRLPDAALLRQADFEPHGGVPAEEESELEGHSRTPLEELIGERMQKTGADVVVHAGRVFPQSALNAWVNDPIKGSPTKGGSALSSVAASVASDVEMPSRAASPASALNGHAHHLLRSFAPPLSPSPAPPLPPRHAPPRPQDVEGAAPADSPAPPMSLTMPGSLGMDIDD
ncbi:hypothetical protein JCM10213_004608 [Rhodosporidiobolus nylandii]